MATAGARLPTGQLLGLIPSKQKLGLMVALAAITALVVAGWLWGQSPDYRVLYANLSDREKAKVSRSFELESFPAGTTIVREGDKGRKFYIIKDGSASVSNSGQVIKQLESGEYFGEMALLDDELASEEALYIHIYRLRLKLKTVGEDVIFQKLGRGKVLVRRIRHLVHSGS